MIQISADILRTYAASDWPDGMSTAFGCVSSGGDLPFCSRVCVHVARGSFLYFSLSLFFSLFSSSLFSLHRYDWSKTHDDDGTELGGTCGTIAGPWLVTIELAMHEVSIRDLWRVAVFFYLFDLLWSLIVLTQLHFAPPHTFGRRSPTTVATTITRRARSQRRRRREPAFPIL